MSETFQLEYIHLHPDIQVRIYQNDDALERYTELYKADSKALPPIKICISSKDQRFYLIDGHHRFRAAKAAGLTMIQAENLGEMDLPQMVQESIRANCQQGLALSKADRKRAAEMLVKYNPEITVRAAAEAVGLSKSLVATVLKEYREKTIVQCSECKATVLRLYAEDSTNGWVHVPETKRDRWFCCEEHRREFYAKQAEKEAAKQVRREALEEERNSKLEAVPEPEADSEVTFDFQAELEKPTVTFTQNISEFSSSGAIAEFESSLKPCPFCGLKPTLLLDYDKTWSVLCENKQCHFTPSTDFYKTAEEAKEVWNNRVQPDAEAEPEDSFAELLLKFLRKGHKWKQNGHTFYLELQSNVFAGKDGFLVIRSGGLKGCAALQSTYLLPDLTTPKTSEEAEK